MELPRPAFKPSRPRASIGAIPSSASGVKENRPSTSLIPVPTASPAQSRKKRAQSLGGDALEAARKVARMGGGEILFGQRRKLVSPRAGRGVLLFPVR